MRVHASFTNPRHRRTEHWLPLVLLAVACGIAERHVDERDDTGASGSGGASSGNGSFGGAGFGSTGTGVFGGFGPGPTPGGAAGTTGIPSYGGKIGAGGMPPGRMCTLPVPVISPSECGQSAGGQGAGGAAEGGSGSETTAGGQGGERNDDGGAPNGGAPEAAAGAAGESGEPAVTSCGGPSSAGNAPQGARLVLDDFEDGDPITASAFDAGGVWYVVNDGTGQQFPAPCTVPSLIEGPAPRPGTRFAMRTYGTGFVSGPGSYSLVGMSFRSGPPACTKPFDASEYQGVEFWARGSGFVRFFIGTAATVPVIDFGRCEAGCYDKHGTLITLTEGWQLYRVPFNVLVQEGWGFPASFDSAQILSFEWTSKADELSGFASSCFDFWIDDVALYRP